MVSIARHALGLKRLHSGHFVDNPASGRVLQKLGFRATGTVKGRYSAGRGAIAPCRLFELDLAERGGGGDDRQRDGGLRSLTGLQLQA